MSDYGITHESGKLEKVMVHQPGKELELANRDPTTHHFEMPVNTKRFICDHKEFIDKLEETGVEVLDVRNLVKDNPTTTIQIQECPNLVFVRDSSTMTSRGALIMRMGLPSRRKETPVIQAAYKALNIPVAFHLTDPETFEGGGFALLEGRVGVAGLCDRTTPGAIDRIGDYLLKESLVDLYITLKMPPGAIHIDGEFAELPGKVAISHLDLMNYVPTNFRTKSEKWEGSFTEWLREDGWDIVEITDRECINMAANFLTIDRDLAFHYTGNTRVMKEVNERGIEVVQIPGKEMRKGLGGIHCMTCPIKRV
jgi:arginine deiminase